MDMLSQVLDKTYAGDDFYLLLGDFLDEFYKAGQDIKQRMIVEPPSANGLKNDCEYLCFAAATAHKLANDYKLNVPTWVFEEQFYMDDKPFFACGARGDIRLLFMYKSPAEFKHRNMFVDENVLARV